MSESASTDIQINVKGPNELKLQITISTDKTVQELKQAIAAQSNVEADRQRLIYSGRVLKDEDALSVYKIQTNHTIHMVKGAARSAGGSTSSQSQPSTTQPLPSMQTGQNPHDPLTLLNSHLGYGAMAGLNPFQDMGLNPNDPNMLQTMMNSPQFLQQMSAMMSNPAIVDQIIASNPQLQAMAPQVRATFQNPAFREMISDPQRLQQMFQMASLFGPPGGMLGGHGTPSFPAPGVPGSTPASSTPGSTATSAPGSPPTDGANANPWASLLGGMGGAGSNTTGNQNYGFDPALMQQMLSLGGGGFGSPPPADPRPPEERFQVQLQQLQDMGFTNAAQNVRALLATGGNVHSAIEYILGGGGL